jgi:serine/threonine protein kinase
MIAFSCSHCGMKLKVQDQFAGRPAKCPTCKQPLVVPLPSAAVPYSPPQQIDGAESSLANAGLEGGVTLGNDPAGRKPTAVTGQKPQRSVSDALALRQKNTQRYVVEGEIARGGMGAVLRAVDCDIRREVAVKYMLDDKDPKKKARFIEEAQINGQLEHPNIVPVYDLGIDAQKRPFIMMKMVKGRSLKEVLDQLRDQPKQAEQEFTLGRLLNILVNVCNALSFAHARNVIHRDLKPANIMLGDFGEVYVMDWGLAKVLNQPGAAEKLPQAVMATDTASVADRNAQVVTSRAPEADLTQEGSVLGTPVYMPPEQATGRLDAIDQRSDVYSLGAILYELLTLQPPVLKEGGHLAVLMQVMQGEIIPPQQREPLRTRAGKVPKELAAVAMKALAKEKENRYSTADALRQDIERFQEGRSVSAKDDTFREAVWRLVKRNKLASAFTALLAMVLVWSSWANYEARRATENAQQEKNQHITDSLPSFVRAARLAANNKQHDDALKQLKVVLDHDPNQTDARLLRAQVLIVQQDFAEAQRELNRYLALAPQDTAARQQVKLCPQAQTDNLGTLIAFAETFQRQNAPELASQVLQAASGELEGRKRLLPIYQKHINAAWPTLGNRLALDTDGKFVLQLNDCGALVKDLSPLKSLPLNSLTLSRCDTIMDLSPLKGMPLQTLILTSCVQVRDLTPLQELPLTSLNLASSEKIADLTPLKGMSLRALVLTSCGQVRDLSPLQGMSLTSLDLVGCGQVRDLSPLRAMPLTSLSLQVSDLTPLKGLRLTSLGLPSCDQLRDLTPLRGMPLSSLYLAGCDKITDLTPLRGMSLTMLHLGGCVQVRDLSPLKGMPLTSLNIAGCGQGQLLDLTPLKSLMSLTSLTVDMRDLTPLQDMSLTEVFFSPKNVTKGLDVLRQMKSLKTIGESPVRNWPADQFWKKYDAGEFK